MIVRWNIGLNQARSQKLAMGGGAVLGIWGLSPQPPKTDGGLGAKPPGLEAKAEPSVFEKFAFFLQKFHFRPILIKK